MCFLLGQGNFDFCRMECGDDAGDGPDIYTKALSYCVRVSSPHPYTSSEPRHASANKRKALACKHLALVSACATGLAANRAS